MTIKIQSDMMSLMKLREYITARIDHYTPYRPFLDSPEAQLVREELTGVLQLLPEEEDEV